jgi:hypothetical protein
VSYDVISAMAEFMVRMLHSRMLLDLIIPGVKLVYVRSNSTPLGCLLPDNVTMDSVQTLKVASVVNPS